MPPDTAAPAVRDRHPLLGIALLASATLLFSTHTNLARLSYDYGVETLTILAARSIAALPLAYLWLRWQRQPAFLPRRALPMLAITGGAFTMQSLCYLNAIHYIPVSLAVLLFYLFPIMVIFIARALGQERLTTIRIAGAVVAFAGLALALNVRGNGINWLGVGLGAAAALSLAVNIVGAVRMMVTAPVMTVTFNMLLVAAVVYTVAVIATGGPAWPSGGDGAGWLVFAGVLVTGPLAQMCFYGALSFIGGSRASIIMNGEPITTTALALLILHESLAPVQIIGGILVVGAIFAVALFDRGRRPGSGARAQPMP